jgi:Tfp pilus assembly protein PilX
MKSVLRLARTLRSDRGVALPVVVGLGLVMLILVAGGMSVATSGLQKTNTDEDWNGALAAAYAGVEEYQSRLANDSTYQKYGNKNAEFSADSTLTLPTGANANPAFGIGPSGTWATVSGSDGRSSFRYEVDNSDYQNKGILHLRSTGRVGDVTRSIVADLKQDGFIDYLYFTNYETLDPAYIGVTTLDSNNKNICERYAYGSPARNSSSCGGEIQFGQFDTFGGSVRSNDRMTICGTNFEGPVITSSTTNPSWVKPSGCSKNPTWGVGSGPTVQGVIDMPPTNTELKKETRNDLPDEVPRPGCLYTGPTQITFVTVGGVPKMRVLSPWTRYTNVPGSGTTGTNPAQCGTPGNVTNGLGSPNGAELPVLDLNLIFVQAVPAANSGNPNQPASSSAGWTPPNVTCTSGGSGKPPGWTYSTGSGSSTTYYARYPANNEITPGGASTLVHYGCKAGDLYVKGTLGGQTTLAAENYIYVTGNLTYLDKQADMLGLIGQNAVFVWNPINSSENPLLGDTNREIDAAILSVGHTFQVQNYDRSGPRGTLTVFGAMAQKFRGTVATTSNGTVTNGYAKDYQYDDRFRSTAPPKFLTPVSTTYGVTQYATVPAAFAADGTAQ